MVTIIQQEENKTNYAFIMLCVLCGVPQTQQQHKSELTLPLRCSL